jgi:hypothetical protein
MESLLTAAARALAAGDPLGALKRIALREDAPSLALRGIAMAQLGELGRSKDLLRRAARKFGPRESLARARCEVARAEVALAARDFEPPRALAQAERALAAHGDRFNALYARLLSIRRLLLLGRVDGAARALEAVDLDGAPAVLAAIGELTAAELALRRVHTRAAAAALDNAGAAARRAGIPALVAEVEHAARALSAPAARLVAHGSERSLLLAEVEEILASQVLLVDACRRVVRDAHSAVALARRPVLFALARCLASAWPDDVTRERLILEAFAVRRVNESHRVRLRVEMGRLRRELRSLAGVRATKRGFLLEPTHASSVAVLLPLIDGEDAALLALLADGEAWSTSSLALALGLSQRTVQRALSSLASSGRVHSMGSARARRWLAPPASGFTTTLLLPTSLPVG